jgi:hypothetical protein
LLFQCCSCRCLKNNNNDDSSELQIVGESIDEVKVRKDGGEVKVAEEEKYKPITTTDATNGLANPAFIAPTEYSLRL